MRKPERLADPQIQEPRHSGYLAAVAALDRFASERFGKNVLALAVRWILDRGGTVALWGGRKPEQLAPVNQVLGCSLDRAASDEIDSIFHRTISDPVGPEFMAPPKS